jgi:hypothetical protein
MPTRRPACAVLDADGRLTKKPGSPSANEGAVQVFSGGLGGQVTPDGLSVNTTQPPWQPSGVPPAEGGSLDAADPKGTASLGQPLPPQRQDHRRHAQRQGRVLGLVFGRMERRAGRRAPAAGGEAADDLYAQRGQPDVPAASPAFNYYERFARHARSRRAHQGRRRLRARHRRRHAARRELLQAGRPLHPAPSYTDVKSGDEHMAALLAKLRASPQWKDMLIVLTYDENGGYWDHVPPRRGAGWGDRLGPGTRIRR